MPIYPASDSTIFKGASSRRSIIWPVSNLSLTRARDNFPEEVTTIVERGTSISLTGTPTSSRMAAVTALKISSSNSESRVRHSRSSMICFSSPAPPEAKAQARPQRCGAAACAAHSISCGHIFRPCQRIRSLNRPVTTS